ncbi:MAG: dTMP kinase [Nitrospirae bacterium]|nr:dTMP kinase [Nitrospirota bacterium]
MTRGIFISFEGIEGTGKTTQVVLIKEYLEKKRHTVIISKEPGGTAISERIREILLSTEHKEMDSLTELFLYFASRRQHIKELIVPSLEAGKIVITDRFSDSTKAYQGYARGIDVGFIDTLNKAVTGGLMPDLTVLLDTDVETGLKRNMGINKLDRLELEDIEFHKRVREGYLLLAKKEPNRIKVVDAGLTVEKIHDRVVEIVEKYLMRGQSR